MAILTRGGFFQGLATGALSALLVGVALIYVLNITNVVAISVIRVPEIQHLLRWAYHNLGLSLILFALTLILYFHSLRRLKKHLGAAEPVVEKVAQAEHLVDVWTGLFFGIGVIWTAIGMRGALLYAVGDPATAAQDGAFAILQRLVDGGILVALSTTIFGGVGGYIMRIFKALTVGAELQRYYSEVAQAQGADIHATLTRIERALHTLVRCAAASEETPHDSSSLAADVPRHSP